MRQATQKKEAINFNWPIWNLPKKPLKVMFWLLRSQIFILPSHLIQCNWNKSKRKKIRCHMHFSSIFLFWWWFDFIFGWIRKTHTLSMSRRLQHFFMLRIKFRFFQRFYIFLTRMILMIPSTSENRHEKILITSLKI
jgi:hypothetical protein